MNKTGLKSNARGQLYGFQGMDRIVVRQHHAQKSALPSDSSGLNIKRKRRKIRYTPASD